MRSLVITPVKSNTKGTILGLLVLFSTIGQIQALPESPHFSYFESVINNGVKTGCGGDWGSALEHFDFVVASAPADSFEMGEALFGKVIAHISLGNKAEAKTNMALMRNYARSKWGDHGETFELPDQYRFAPNEFDEEDYREKTQVRFLDPDERINPAECKGRASKSADKLKSMVKDMVNELQIKIVQGRRETITERDKKEILEEFYRFIDELLSRAEYCCNQCVNSNIWTKCITPIFERYYQWSYLGLPQDPR